MRREISPLIRWLAVQLSWPSKHRCRVNVVRIGADAYWQGFAGRDELSIRMLGLSVVYAFKYLSSCLVSWLRFEVWVNECLRLAFGEKEGRL